MQTSLTPKEVFGLLKHYVLTNKHLQSIGKNPLSISISGPAGIGKTAVVKQIQADPELNIKHFHRINLSQLDELGDLIGIPQKEVHMITPDGKNAFIDEKLIEHFLKKEYKLGTGQSRMGYSKPAWIANKGENGILLLDDFTRAQPRFMQAIMEIVECQEYISWSLPKGWTVVLTENPGSGQYDVAELDDAVRTRFATHIMEFDITSWLEWATGNIDSRCINFMLINKDMFKSLKDSPFCNPRTLEKFFNAITTFKNYEGNLNTIQLIGEGIVGVEVTSLFTSFVNGRLDRLPEISYLLDPANDFEKIEKLLKSIIGSGEQMRGDISYTISMRLLTHVNHTYTEHKKPNQQTLDRIIALLKCDAFGKDLEYVLTERFAANPKLKAIIQDKELVDRILED